MRPALAVVGVFPRVSALKMVVFPDWGSPIIPSFILTLLMGLVYTVGRAEVAEQADAHDSKSCSFGIVGSIPTFGIISFQCGHSPAFVSTRECLNALAFWFAPAIFQSWNGEAVSEEGERK